ncbi:glutamine amidotransferase [Akkermansia sp.]|uniref:glutamine amidotransferase n=1 Tax=Akkermansia sp. TaxID=1872421 RepID=UPI0025C2D041|nr:glutamine amidotransferase [Akkermansia sp.]MCC8148743.1 glutamine amidotransferase [Akkermansia sp.]
MNSRSSFRTCLALRHVAFEDLGTLEPLLRDRGFQIRYAQPGFPWFSVEEWLAADLCVVLGGPVGVGDTELYPYLKTELDWVRSRLACQRPLLGICLGSQMMAHALGSRVYPGTAREIGWGAVSLTEAGRLSPLRHLEGIPVLHWHGDTFDMPAGARLLASTEITPHQAFCVGNNALALQFHPEADVARMEEWLTGHACELMAAGTDIPGLRAASVRHGALLADRAALCMNEWMEGAGL